MADSVNSKNYSGPVYGAGWLPPSTLRSPDDGDKSSSSSPGNYVVLAGGGGEGNSGIRNALIVAQFDFDSNVLSDEPVARLGTGGDPPYRMAVHPVQDGKLRVYKWPSMESILDQANAHASVKDLDFSPDGKFLASVGSGPCRIWDVSKSTSVASLMKENRNN